MAQDVAQDVSGAAKDGGREVVCLVNRHLPVAADGFIEAFRDGYAMLVGEQGVCVSGRQKQRITIARALLVGPRVRACAAAPPPGDHGVLLAHRFPGGAIFLYPPTSLSLRLARPTAGLGVGALFHC